jgi:fatty-acyl-CoA synthase
VLTRYLGSDESTATAFTDDGWFRSGDLGFLTGVDAELVYTCRAGDALRLRGFLVEPAEIEEFLMSHPQVSLAKVVGVRVDQGADVAVAFVTVPDGSETTAAEILAYSHERLAAFKVPAALRVIDEFPVTTGTNGTKIRTAELRLWAEDVLRGAGGGKQ